MNKTATADQVIEELGQHLETVSPGQPTEFTTASTPNDIIWQGDLGLMILEEMPKDYIVQKTLTDANKKLVPGGNEGARHCLAHLDGVEIAYPEGWGKNEELLNGPAFRLTVDNEVQHPKHGNVKIPAGFVVGCYYQREYDAEQKRERRARD